MRSANKSNIINLLTTGKGQLLQSLIPDAQLTDKNQYSSALWDNVSTTNNNQNSNRTAVISVVVGAVVVFFIWFKKRK